MHIIDQLLEHGYRVRGTVRDAEKAVWTSKYFKDKYGIGRYTTAIIQDMAKQWAFDIAIRGCAGIIHVASVTSMSPDPNEVITPSIAGAINALESAHKEINLKRFVLCSSVDAAVSCYRGERNEVSSESWNMLDFEDAWAPEPFDNGRARAVYASSKMQTEAAVWRWYHRRKPQFVLNTGTFATTSPGAERALTIMNSSP
jgi:nucleoside-diphosphate-sugar epimerase